MKKSLFLAIALAINALFTLSPFEAKAIIHFDDSYNFDAYSMGSGRIHFKALIYWEDRVAAGIADRYKEYFWSDYTDYPNAWYQISGGAKQKIVEYNGNSYWNKPGRDGRPEEYCRVSLKVVTGTLVVTNTYTGTHATVNAPNLGTGTTVPYSDFNSYTLGQWGQMERAGAVFLPAALGSGGEGRYWTPGASDGTSGQRLYFNNHQLSTSQSELSTDSCSVRLAKIMN